MAVPSPQPNTDSFDTSGGNATDDGVTDDERDDDETLKRFKQLLQELFRQGESYMGACRTLHSCLGDDENFAEIKQDCEHGNIEDINRFLSDIGQSLEKCREEFAEFQRLCQREELKELLHSCECIVKRQRRLSDDARRRLGNRAGGALLSLIAGVFTAYSPPTTLALGTTLANFFGATGVLGSIACAWFTIAVGFDFFVKRRQLQETRESCGIDVSSTRLDRVRMLTQKMRTKMENTERVVDQINKLFGGNKQGPQSPIARPVIDKIVKTFQELRKTLHVFSLKDFDEVIVSGLSTECEPRNLSSSNIVNGTSNSPSN